MKYCNDNGSGVCGGCGIPFPDSRYTRECGPLTYWLEQHAAVEQMAQPAPPPPAPLHHGPGTELSRLLKRIGINPTPTCQCRAKAEQMDQWGCDECSKPERIDEVVKVMREEATARGLPFIDIAGRMLVRRAIANARRNA